jgi:hypothetical protein
MDFWEDFWSIFWWFVWAFVFIAYLMVLFSIIADVFRDRALNGWLKAIWVLFLVFLPFITALVYLIARGNGMAQRNVEMAQQRQDATNSYIRGVAGASPTEEIEKAARLRDAGTITEAEFESIKARALA